MITGTTAAQQQSERDTPDPSVGRDRVSVDSRLTVPSPLRVSDRRPGCTTVDVDLWDDPRRAAGALSLDLIRLLPGDADTGLGHVEARWIRLDGRSVRGTVAVIR